MKKFRVELTSIDKSVHIECEFEARADWPFPWWPRLAPGTYELKVFPDKGVALRGHFVVEDLLPRIQPILVHMR